VKAKLTFIYGYGLYALILTEDILLSNQGKVNAYLGSETQGIDDIMAKYIDSSILSAYRGVAYAVIEDFPLGDYGNRIPNFSVLYCKKDCTSFYP
jgi:hypothetical protein